MNDGGDGKTVRADGRRVAERIGETGWTSTLEVRQLRAFLAVVVHGSVSGAAASLGLAQSTVSEALAALDRSVGAPTVLRRRGAREMALTDAGQALLPHARRVLEELDAAHVAIASVTRVASASVAVTANESVSTYLLAPALGVLRKRWPNVRFSVTVGTCDIVRADVAGGTCDLGLLLEDHAGAHAESATAITLADEFPLVIFAGTKHPLARGTHNVAARGDAISSFPMFVADAAGDFHELIRRYLAGDGLPGPRLEPVGSIDSVKRGVDADPLTLGILPLYAVAEDIRLGRVRALELRPPPPQVRLVALLPPTRTGRHPAVTELLEQLRAVH